MTRVAVRGWEAGGFREREVMRGVGRRRAVVGVSRGVELNVMSREKVSFQVWSGVGVSGVTGRSVGEWLLPLRTTDLIIKVLRVAVFLCHHAGLCKVGLGLGTRKQNTFLLKAQILEIQARNVIKHCKKVSVVLSCCKQICLNINHGIN